MDSPPLLLNQNHTTLNETVNKTVLRHGYTMVEVIIASTIMFTLVTSLLSAWSATMSFSYMVNESLKRMSAIDNIRTTLRADFNQSAQMIQYDSAVMVASVNTSTNENITLYPSILQGGRELQYVMLRNSLMAASDPTAQSTITENLTGTNGQPLSQYALAPVSPFFIINPNSGQPGYWNLSPVWDSNLSQLTFNQNADPANLRIYRYILLPYSTSVPTSITNGVTYSISSYPLYPEAGATIRRGMLVKQYRNANTTTWQTIGLPLSDAVAFDTTNDENSTTLPCFIFATAYDGVTRTGTESIGDSEVRMKFSLAMVPQNNSTTAVMIDLRLSFPFRRIDYGE